jgi:hypothetical protein
MLDTEADLERCLKINMQKKTRVPVTSENKMISIIVNYTNILPTEKCTSEEEMLNIDSNAPVMHSSSDREEGNIVSTGEKIPIDSMMTMCGQLIAGLEQGTLKRT